MRLVSTTLVGPGTPPAVLAEAVASIATIVDEAIVVWTGHDTKEDAEAEAEASRAVMLAAGNSVWKRWPWQNDFGKARQAALDIATEAGADWCLWLDSDELMQPNGKDIRAALESLPDGVPAASMLDALESYTQPRAIRLPCASKWRGRTHETITFSVVLPMFDRARFFERPKTAEQMKSKLERDLEYLRATVEQEPETHRWWLYLGGTLDLLGRHDEAIEVLTKRAEMGGWDEEAAWACFRAAGVEFNRGRWAEVIRHCARGIAIHPGLPELPWLAASASQRLGRPHHAVWWAELAKAHGTRSTCPFPALQTRTLFRWPDALNASPYEIQRDSLRALVVDSHVHARADAELASWSTVAAPKKPMGSKPRLVVTSTARNAERFAARCIESVNSQNYTGGFSHIYLDAQSTDNTLTEAKRSASPWTTVISGSDAPVLEHLSAIWRTLEDDDVVVWLDGDDWLVTDDALRVVAEAHAEGYLATYGQFIWPDGRLGFAGAVGARPRSESWRATHLKTFRAGLAKRIRDEDLRMADGSYAGLVCDQRVMLAVLEMAGPGRHKFIPNVLYHYNAGNAWEATASPGALAEERAELERVRGFAPYGVVL